MDWSHLHLVNLTNVFELLTNMSLMLLCKECIGHGKGTLLKIPHKVKTFINNKYPNHFLCLYYCPEQILQPNFKIVFLCRH